MNPKKKRLSRDEKLVRTVTHPQTGESIDVILSTSTLKFWARVDSNQFMADTADAVIAWADERLRERAHLTWIPVLHILVEREPNVLHNLKGSYDKKRGEWLGNNLLNANVERLMDPAVFNIAAVGCSIQFRRVYIAKTANGWRSLTWHLFTPETSAETAIQDSIEEHGLPFEFDGTLPYVDRGAEYHGARRKIESEEHETRAILAYDEAIWITLTDMANVLDRARQTITDLIGKPDKLAAFTAERLLALGTNA